MYVGASLIGNALFFCCLYNKYIYCSFALLGWLIFKHCGRFFNRKRPFFFLVCSPLSVVRCLLSVVCCLLSVVRSPIQSPVPLLCLDQALF